jgi:hypothetical protein
MLLSKQLNIPLLNSKHVYEFRSVQITEDTGGGPVQLSGRAPARKAGGSIPGVGQTFEVYLKNNQRNFSPCNNYFLLLNMIRSG